MTTAKPIFEYKQDIINVTEHFTPDSNWSTTSFNSEKVVSTSSMIEDADFTEDKIMQAQFNLVRNIQRLRAETLRGNSPSAEIRISEENHDEIDHFWIKVSQFDK